MAQPARIHQDHHSLRAGACCVAMAACTCIAHVHAQHSLSPERVQAVDGLAPDGSGVAHLNTRLAQLSPKNPMDYFELAEEVAYEFPADDQQARSLATTLFVLAHELHKQQEPDAAADSLTPSVCLALADLLPGEQAEDARWLRELSRSLGGETGEGLYTTGPTVTLASERERLAQAMVRFRGADYAKTRSLLGRIKPSPHAVLIEAGMGEQQADSLINLINRVIEREGTAAPQRGYLRPDPTGMVFVLDEHNRGNPGPSLDDEQTLTLLRAEMLLLDGQASRWSLQALIGGQGPFRELDTALLQSMFKVDTARPYFHFATDDWREGAWMTSPHASE